VTDTQALIDRQLPDLVQLRHDLHRHPELAYEERDTAARIVRELEGLDGLDIRTGGRRDRRRRNPGC
jgi:metal-dependent amidase/aminoacylase/carboxypeptidase family protein